MTDNHDMNDIEQFLAELPEGDPMPTSLPFPTIKHHFGDEVVEEYIIPDEKRAEVLEQLCFFDPVPGLDETWIDIHEDRPFKIRDYKVVKDNHGLWLVSPYFFSSGGTVIDWFPADKWNDDGEEEDEDDAPEDETMLPF